jgi:hypothetical protein
MRFVRSLFVISVLAITAVPGLCKAANSGQNGPATGSADPCAIRCAYFTGQDHTNCMDSCQPKQ